MDLREQISSWPSLETELSRYPLSQSSAQCGHRGPLGGGSGLQGEGEKNSQKPVGVGGLCV